MNKRTKSRFGELLTRMIKDSGMTQSDFYTRLGITKPYFYDIIGGKANPPPPDMQFKIVSILQLNEKARSNLFQVAGEERKEIPADIVLYLNADSSAFQEIRKSVGYAEIIGGKVNG